MTRIASSSPGRIRVKDPALRGRDCLSRVHKELAPLEGVRELRPNLVAGSIVVFFDHGEVSPAKLEQRIEQALDAALAAPRKARRSIHNRVNRAAKIGMLGSLGASLALAATGNKRWHAVTGGVFVACLGVHLGLHRKALLR
ncbi:MAG TPA: hypothetical protein P5537_06885 [Thauera sp.]|mgnify:FL=1|uniref:HMA2 domain-containing protein n=1 Tax=Thauera sp. TaxID=1905334 RepID=UPI001D42D920|nr:hypothetical protein [Thauera sp.]MCB1947074.1 hypothetical protein [Thauera sp.]MCP5225422.1 hypothetical protein [Thauera sp.]HPE03625.1 hypothetical protein [Thauera sp.]HRV77803.1 hypothetical protein [Thauera sp.]